MTSLFLMMIAAAAPADKLTAAPFTIESPSQTARSVFLAWETDQKVRTLKVSRRWHPSTPTGATHQGGESCFRVFFRKAGQTAWQAVEAVVLERFHNVIFLEPETTYQFKVQRITATRRIETESQVLTAATRREADRTWEGLRWGSDDRTPTPPAVYPCIKSLGGKLYYAESRVGSLWLSELDGEWKTRWTKEWVKPYLVDGKPCYQGQSQAAVRAGKLYISWKRAFHGDAPHARQCVASYDPATGAIGKPLVIEPDRPGDSTWNGGIAAIGDQLWVSYCLWHPEGESYKTTITVRRLDYENGKLGPVVTLSPQPTATPYTPFLSVFSGELAVCFTESQAKTDQQPLYLVRCDGTRFHDLMTVSPSGFNQYAKGVQYGDKLLLLWKYGGPYPSRIYGRYMFHDIGMALIDPVSKSVKLTSLVDDLKYNSSPDITEHEGGFVYVYNKHEHLYGEPGDPAKLYGCFIGRIAPPGKNSRP
jgi:hypothetical protein